MSTTNTGRSKEGVGQLRLKTTLTVALAWLLGGYVALSIRKKHNDFYPFQIAVLGFLTVSFTRAPFLYLARLSWSMVQEDEKRKKLKARRLMAYILCTMLVSFGFAVCQVAARIFGKLYTVSAVVMGIFIIWMAWATDREIRSLARCFFSPRNESVTDIAAQTPSTHFGDYRV